MIYIHRITRPNYLVEIEEFIPMYSSKRCVFCGSTLGNTTLNKWDKEGRVDMITSRSYNVMRNRRTNELKLVRNLKGDFSFEVLSR